MICFLTEPNLSAKTSKPILEGIAITRDDRDKNTKEEYGENKREELEKKLFEEKNSAFKLDYLFRKALTGDPQGWLYVLIVIVIVATFLILR